MKFILANVPPGQSDSHIAAPNWIQVWLSAALSCMLYAVQCNLSCDVQAKLATALWEPPKWTNGVKVVLTDVAAGQTDSHIAAPTLISVWLSAALSSMLYAVRCNLYWDVQAELATTLLGAFQVEQRCEVHSGGCAAKTMRQLHSCPNANLSLSTALSSMLYAVQCYLSCDVQAELATTLWGASKVEQWCEVHSDRCSTRAERQPESSPHPDRGRRGNCRPAHKGSALLLRLQHRQLPSVAQAAD